MSIKFSEILNEYNDEELKKRIEELKTKIEDTKIWIRRLKGDVFSTNTRKDAKETLYWLEKELKKLVQTIKEEI